MEAKHYLVRNPVISTYRITINILLLVLWREKLFQDSESRFDHSRVTNYSPDERRSTPVKIITHRRRNYHVDGCCSGEGHVDERLNKVSCLFGILSWAILTLIAPRSAKLVSSYALTIRTRSWNDEFGVGTKELDSRNPMPTTGKESLVKGWAKKMLSCRTPSTRHDEPLVVETSWVTNMTICEKLHTTRAGRNREKCFPTFVVSVVRGYWNNVKELTFPYSHGV